MDDWDDDSTYWNSSSDFEIDKLILLLQRMTATQSLQIYEVIQRNFNNDADAKIVVQEIEQIVSEKFLEEKENIALRSEIMLMRKDLEVLRQEMKTGFAESESRIKSEINKLIVWIIATMFGAAVLIITLAKLFFDK